MLVPLGADSIATLFTDAACKGDRSVLAYIAMRDEQFLGMRADYGVGLTSVEAEVMSVVKGLQFLTKLGYRKVEVHSDNQVVIKVITEKDREFTGKSLELRNLCDRYDITAVKVRGHSGISPQDICGNIALRMLQ